MYACINYKVGCVYSRVREEEGCERSNEEVISGVDREEYVWREMWRMCDEGVWGGWRVEGGVSYA